MPAETHPQTGEAAGTAAQGRRRRWSLFGLTFALPMPIWQALFFVFPLCFLVVLTFWLVKNYRMVPGFDTVNWVKMYTRGYFWDAYQRTFVLALISSAVTSALAFPAAYALAFKVGEAARRWAIFFLIIPFFTSYLVRAYAWQVIIGDNGVVNGALGFVGLGPLNMLNTPVGTLIGYLTLCLPLVVILQLISLSNVDRNLIEAAWNLGCGRLRTVATVIVPLAKVGLIIGAVFAFILSFGDFVSPYYLGGSKPPTLSILIIDTTKSGQQWPRAAVVAVTMIATLMVVAFAAVSAAYRKKA
jgi:spermidine/putrescine transport system permease protein/putrescine transport system permease protein